MNKKVCFCAGKFYRMFSVGVLSLFVCTIGGEVDNIVAGNVINESALAAVGIVTSVYNLIIFFSVIVGNGGAIYYSRFMGKFQKENAYKSLCTSIFGAFIMGALLVVGVTAFEDPLLNFFGVSPDLLEYSHEYYSYFKVIAFIYPIYWLLYEIVYNDGDEKIAALSDVVQFAVNLILSVVLCFNYGLAGISFSTMVCILLSTLILLLHFIRKQNSVKVKLAFNVRFLLRSLRYSGVEASTYLYAALLNIVLNKCFIMAFGDFYLPVLDVALFGTTIGGLGQGIGNAITPFVCIYNSENNNPGLKNIMKYALKACLIAGLIMSLSIFFGAELIASVFGVVTPELLDKSVFVLRCFSLTVFFMPFGYCFSQFYLIMGRFLYGIIFTGIYFLVAPYVCTYIGAEIGGIYGSLIGFGLYPLIATIFIVTYLLIVHRRKFPFLLPKQNNHVININRIVKKDNIDSLKNEAEKFMTKYIDSKKTINKVLLLIEEISLVVINNNKDNKVIAEFTIIVNKNQVKLIERDNGVLCDITNTNQQCNDLNIYLLTNYMEYLAGKVYLKSTGFNRCSFIVEEK